MRENMEAVTDIETLSIFSDRALQLLKALSAEKADDDVNASQSLQNKVNSAVSVGVRGRTYYSDSDEDDERSTCSDSESSVFSTDGTMDVAANEQIAADTHKHNISSSSFTTSKSAVKRKKTKSKKKTKEELVKQMGMPPTASITIDVKEHSKTALILKIPGVLLPQREEEENRFIVDENKPSPMTILYQLFKNLNKPMSKSSNKNLILILTLQSGKFAAVIYHKDKCIRHTTSSRYTTRKGQGGAQSSNDNSKGKAKSMGSQLRRAGEVQLRQDVASVLREWKGLIRECALFFVSISKTLQKSFWEDAHKTLGGVEGSCMFYKKSPDVMGIPLDIGKPSYEGCCAVYEILTTCILQRLDLQLIQQQQTMHEQSLEPIKESNAEKDHLKKKEAPPARKEVKTTALTLLHKAVKESNLEELTFLLSIDSEIDNIDIRAGLEEMTPLHLAAESNDSASGSESVYKLLVHGHANPCILDSRNRPPYFLASTEPIRNAFRKARAEIGEDRWKWDEKAKVGPPLSEAGMKLKKTKAAEKKRKQKQRQKERKIQEQVEKEAQKKAKDEEEAKERTEEEARRIRAGLPKTSKAARVGERPCDFCVKVCKRRSQMFERLDFYYCSTDCVKQHQRKLSAGAALARFNK